MPIFGLGSSLGGYTAVQPTAQQTVTEAPVAASTDADEPRPSTTVTLTNGSVSEVNAYTGALNGTPLSITASPQLFVQADKNNDLSLSLEEFTDQMARIGVSQDDAAQLFDSINVSRNAKLSLDDFVTGVAATNAQGNDVFQKLYMSYISHQDGTFDERLLSAFMDKGASVAAQYWGAHPDLQRRT